MIYLINNYLCYIHKVINKNQKISNYDDCFISTTNKILDFFNSNFITISFKT